MWACFEATYLMLKNEAPDYLHEMFGASSPSFSLFHR
jgi:hypothetical protein